MLKVGLTGGIGCGKSTVCELFASLGASIIDTDELAREVVLPGTPALQQLVEHFGESFILEDGSLNRQQLRERVFSNPAERELLERITHPAIRKLLEQRMAAVNSPYVVIAIPLLLEKSWQDRIDRVLVIDCDEELQLERASKRDSNSREQILRIIHSQIPRQQRVEAADDIIHNDADIKSLKEQVQQLHRYYTQLGEGEYTTR